MDTITHVLSAVLVTDPIRMPALPGGYSYPRWRDRMAVVLGATIMDIDGTLGWFSQMIYGNLVLYAKYHRVATHSILGLALFALVAALIAQHWPERWLLPFLRPKDSRPRVRPTLRRLFGLASIAALCHFIGDAITAWGTLKPFWPFSNMDFQLKWVNSLELPMLLITLTFWALQNHFLSHGKRKCAWATTVFWFIACTVYILVRPMIFSPPFT